MFTVHITDMARHRETATVRIPILGISSVEQLRAKMLKKNEVIKIEVSSFEASAQITIERARTCV